MQWILATLAFVAVSISGQSLGRNNGIKIRLSQRGLSYAAQKAADDFYDKFRTEKIKDFNVNNGQLYINVLNIKVAQMSRPTLNLQIMQGQGVSPIMHLNSIQVTGDFRVKSRLGWFWITQDGKFTATASQVSLKITLGVGKDGTGRPKVSVQSCTNNIGSFGFHISAGGIIGWIINMFRAMVSIRVKDALEPMLCEEVRKMVNGKLNEELKELNVTTKLQDDRLLLDYSLLQAPIFAANYIDTVIKGDIAWKGRRTGTPSSLRSWPSVPGSSNRMATIYITDYIMNALGVLLHNDGSLSHNVTRDEQYQIPIDVTCSSYAFCAGSLFPELATHYSDGWLEAGLRTNSPPQMIIGNNVVTGNFSGIIEVYVQRPHGQKIRVATATAQMSIPLSLTISGNMIKAAVGTPIMSLTLNSAKTPALTQFLPLIASGFINNRLNNIGQRGFALPSF